LDLALQVIILRSQPRITLDFLWELNYQILAQTNKLTNQLQPHIMLKNSKALKLWYLELDKELTLPMLKSKSLSQVPVNIYQMDQQSRKRHLVLGLDLVIVQTLLTKNVLAQAQAPMSQKLTLVKKDRQKLWEQ